MVTLSVVFRDPDQANTITRFFQLIGERIGGSIDFPYSPVRLMLLAMPADMTVAQLENVRTAVGLSYLISLSSLASLCYCSGYVVGRVTRVRSTFG